jgi:hypothetical protein
MLRMFSKRAGCFAPARSSEDPPPSTTS